MKNPATLVSVLLFFTISLSAFGQETEPVRQIAWTFDDLPASKVSFSKCDDADLRSFTRQFLQAVEDADIKKATAFVNISKRCDGQSEKFYAEILTLWLDAGHELGNHTWSHQDLNNLTPEEFEEEILKGERIVKELVENRDMKFSWFRYPYLHVGNTAEKKKAVEAILNKHGYLNAPVTIDNSEWVFASAYSDAKKAGDTELMQRIVDAYVPYMEETVEHFEGLSRQLFGYEPKQILLLHANELNADTLPLLAEMLKNRGYQFISLEEALTDPAYQHADTFVSTNGISWIHRWIVSDGGEIVWESDPPKWVMELAGIY